MTSKGHWEDWRSRTEPAAGVTVNVITNGRSHHPGLFLLLSFQIYPGVSPQGSIRCFPWNGILKKGSWHQAGLSGRDEHLNLTPGFQESRASKGRKLP